MEENKTIQAKEKKTYEQPEIVDHGSIEKITEQPVLNPVKLDAGSVTA